MDLNGGLTDPDQNQGADNNADTNDNAGGLDHVVQNIFLSMTSFF